MSSCCARCHQHRSGLADEGGKAPRRRVPRQKVAIAGQRSVSERGSERRISLKMAGKSVEGNRTNYPPPSNAVPVRTALFLSWCISFRIFRTCSRLQGTLRRCLACSVRPSCSPQRRNGWRRIPLHRLAAVNDRDLGSGRRRRRQHPNTARRRRRSPPVVPLVRIAT